MKFNECEWLFRIDLEKIRGIKKKIASKGHSSRKLRSFENSASWRPKVPGKKVNSNGHNSGLGCPFQSIFFLNLRIFSISTQPNCLKAVWASRFFEKRLLLILRRVETRWERKKEIQTAISRASDVRFRRFFFEPAYFYDIYSTETSWRGLSDPIFQKTPFCSFLYE